MIILYRLPHEISPPCKIVAFHVPLVYYVTKPIFHQMQNLLFSVVTHTVNIVLYNKMEGLDEVEKFDLADDVIESLKISERKAKNRASAKRSKQRRLKRMEDLKAEYSRLKLLEAALAMYHEEVRENAKAVVFHVGEMERMVEDYRSRKTQN
jgi:hypothetical protein